MRGSCGAFPDVVEVCQVFWGGMEEIARAAVEEQVIGEAEVVPGVAEVAKTDPARGSDHMGISVASGHKRTRGV